MTIMYTDRELRCRVCGQAFVFSAGEQQYFDRRGFQTPSRCPDCRTGESRLRRGFAGQRRGPASAERAAEPAPAPPPRTWEVTCFRCAAPTHVTFRPREDALVYCPACLDEIFGPYRQAHAGGDQVAEPESVAAAEAG